MAGTGNDVHDPAAQVQLRRPLRPVRQPEEARHGRQVRTDHCGARAVGELAVPGGVVVVAVGVRHQQLVVVPGMAGQPAAQETLDRGPQREELRLQGRAAVHQQRLVGAQQQVQERRFVVHRHVLPQDHGVVVVVVDLDLRVSVVLGRRRAVDPSHVQVAWPVGQELVLEVDAHGDIVAETALRRPPGHGSAVAGMAAGG
jgi:hypothetical protein